MMVAESKSSAFDATFDEMSVDAVLRRFDGDAVAALAAALEDVTFLRREIEYARLAMSYGFSRGWKPALERQTQPLDE